MNAIKSKTAKKIMSSDQAVKQMRRVLELKASRYYAHEHGYVVQTEDGMCYRIKRAPHFF